MHVAWLYIAVDNSCKLPTFIILKKKAVQENKLLMGQKREKMSTSEYCGVFGGL